MSLQGVNWAKLNYLSENFLSYQCLVRLSQKENSWRFEEWKGNSHFVTHTFSCICICICYTFQGNSFSFSVSWNRYVCVTSRSSFCWTPTASKAEATIADVGFGLSSSGEGLYLWVPPCVSYFTLQQPSLLTACSVYLKV